VCPNGHRNWEPTNRHFWCQSCARQLGAEGEFDELHNKATDTIHGRDEVELLTPAGPYDDVHQREGSA